MKAYRGQLWKGKQIKNYQEKKERNSNGVKLFKIVKLQKHLVIVKNYKFYEHNGRKLGQKVFSTFAMLPSTINDLKTNNSKFIV